MCLAVKVNDRNPEFHTAVVTYKVLAGDYESYAEPAVLIGLEFSASYAYLTGLIPHAERMQIIGRYGGVPSYIGPVNRDIGKRDGLSCNLNLTVKYKFLLNPVQADIKLGLFE